MVLKHIASKDIISVAMDDDLARVRALFEESGFHHLLVVENGKLMGVISDRDLLKSISHNIGTGSETTRDLACLSKRAHQIMSRKPITLPETASIFDAIEMFNRHRLSCLPITNAAGKPLGIVSWRDIFRHIEKQRQLRSGVIETKE